MKVFLFVSVLVFQLQIFAQQDVKSKTYSYMLQNLLSHSVDEISVENARALNQDSITWLDAREPVETKVSTIKNAITVGYDNFSFDSLATIDKNAYIIVYCSVGYRSEKISEKLIAAGYKNVKNLYGGLFEWSNNGHSLFVDSSSTSRIHAYNTIWGNWISKGEKVFE